MKPEKEKYLAPDSNISKTGYRALFVLFKLMELPRTRDEILELFSKDPILKHDISKDTVTITVNTLKKAGCIISRPSQRTSNKYVLKSHPFNLHFSMENIDALQALRESIITFQDLYLLIYLNNFYIKIAHLAPDEETKNILIYKHPLTEINYDILNELVIYARIKKPINICYDSPENKKENLDFIPEYLTFESEKLYVWGYCKKYDEFAYLRVDRIKRVNLVTAYSVPEENIEFKKPVETVVYKLKGYSALMYGENKEETVTYEDKDSEYPLTISAEVSNRFNFFQRILSYGTDCLIISPESAKAELKEHLKNIKAGYENEKY